MRKMLLTVSALFLALIYGCWPSSCGAAGLQAAANKLMPISLTRCVSERWHTRYDTTSPDILVNMFLCLFFPGLGPFEAVQTLYQHLY